MARKIRAGLFVLIGIAVVIFLFLMISNGNSLQQLAIIPMLGLILALIVHAITLPFVKNSSPSPAPSAAASSPLAKKYLIPAVIVVVGWLIIARPWEGSFSLGSDHEAAVSKASFGDAWPLTVEEGTLMCLNGVSVVFEAPSGVRYAVNGTAMSLTDYPDIDQIWAADETGIAPKKNIGPLLDRGLELCQ